MWFAIDDIAVLGNAREAGDYIRSLDHVRAMQLLEQDDPTISEYLDFLRCDQLQALEDTARRQNATRALPAIVGKQRLLSGGASPLDDLRL